MTVGLEATVARWVPSVPERTRASGPTSTARRTGSETGLVLVRRSTRPSPGKARMGNKRRRRDTPASASCSIRIRHGTHSLRCASTSATDASANRPSR